jgi:hypothetical protein
MNILLYNMSNKHLESANIFKFVSLWIVCIEMPVNIVANIALITRFINQHASRFMLIFITRAVTGDSQARLIKYWTQ